MKRIEPATILQYIAIVIVAGVFAFAGVQKLTPSTGDATMLGRFITSPQAMRAIGCMEIGLALWLLSGLAARMAGMVALGALLGFTMMIASELYRDRPLPCGCLELKPGIKDPHAVRRGLWFSVGRNALLMGLTVVAIALVPGDEKQGEKIVI